MRVALTLLIVLGLLFGAGSAGAHESRPLYVQITETSPAVFSVTWRVPPSALSVTSPTVVMPTSCRASGPPAGGRLVKRQLFQCQDDLSGATISIDFPGYNPSISTLFRLKRLTGEQYTEIKSPNSPAWRVPDTESKTSVARQYLVLGVEHILKGYDHLLFVACLMFIAGTWRRVLITITGFTVAHSITLALAALQIVRVPVPPVEATIALSIVFLATEIARDRRDTLTWRYPIAVACTFGLLHGFGFASVLAEIGLPQTEVTAALLFFNIGVELGQILFVLVLVATAAALAQLGLIKTDSSDGLIAGQLARPTAYAVGALAVYWTVERISGFVA